MNSQNTQNTQFELDCNHLSFLPKQFESQLDSPWWFKYTTDLAKIPGIKGVVEGGKLGVIPDVLKFGAEFSVYSFGYGDLLERTQCPVIDSGHGQLVAPGIPLSVHPVRALRSSGRGYDADWAPGIYRRVDVVPLRTGPVVGISRPDLVWSGTGERAETLPVNWDKDALPLPRRKCRNATHLPFPDQPICCS